MFKWVTLFFAQDISDINNMINKLKSVSTLEMFSEYDISEFVGARINQRDNITIKLLQTELINRFIESFNLGNQKPKDTPKANEALSLNINRINAQDIYNYRSISGVMIYSSRHS